MDKNFGNETKLVSKPWSGEDVITGKTMAQFIGEANAPGVQADDFAKAAAIRICRSYGITGMADVGYIANVIQAEHARLKGKA